MENMLSEALRNFTGLLKQLITNLLGNDAAEWEAELKKFLRKEPCWLQKSTVFKTKTIRLGTHRSTKDLERTIKESGFGITLSAADILEKTIVAPAEIELKLVNVSLRDLELRHDATIGEVYARAKKLGLRLVPAEVGPQLRLQYSDQQEEEWLAVGMEPLIDYDEKPQIFTVERWRGDRGRLSSILGGSKVHSIYPIHRWIFAAADQINSAPKE